MSGLCPECGNPPERQTILAGTRWSQCKRGHEWNEHGEMATARHNLFGDGDADAEGDTDAEFDPAGVLSGGDA